MEEAAVTQTIGEGRRILQDFVAPELRMLAERLDSVRAEQSRLREDIALVRSEAREMEARLHGDVALVRSELKETDARVLQGLALLRSELKETDARLVQGTAEVRSALKEGLAEVRSELKEGLAEVRSELKESIALVRAEARETEGRLTRLMESHTKEILLTLQLATAEQRSEKLQKQLEERTSAPPAH